MSDQDQGIEAGGTSTEGIVWDEASGQVVGAVVKELSTEIRDELFVHIAPTAVRYIKLGPGGAWVNSSLRNGVVEMGHAAVPHEAAAEGDWERARTAFLSKGYSAGKATDFTRELKDFYTLPNTTLWITMADGLLWWAFTEAEVEPIDEPGRGARCRRVIGRWRSTDQLARPLFLDGLSTKLTKVSAYRQTLCAVAHEDYLIRRINAEDDPVVRRAAAANRELIAAAAELIQQLDWRDFELMADLIFTHGGWRRVSAVGGSAQADSDLILEQALTRERAMVQVKSSANQAVLDDYAGRFGRGSYDRCFFVCHSPQARLASPPPAGFHLWTGERLAEEAVAVGLVPWLIQRCR